MLDGIAALQPLAPPRRAQEPQRLGPEAWQCMREALAATPGLTEAGTEAELEWLERGGFGWQADAGPRLRRSFHTALRQLLLWGGTALKPAGRVALRHWIGLDDLHPVPIPLPGSPPLPEPAPEPGPLPAATLPSAAS